MYVHVKVIVFVDDDTFLNAEYWMNAMSQDYSSRTKWRGRRWGWWKGSPSVARVRCRLQYGSDGGGGLVTKSCPALVTLWTIACQAPLPMAFSRQEYWSGLPFPSPGDLPNAGIEPRSPALQVDSLPTELWQKLVHMILSLSVCLRFGNFFCYSLNVN